MISLHELPNQRRGEITKLFLRRHWITVAVIAANLVGFLLIPFILLIVVRVREFDLFAHPVLGPVTAVGLSVYLLTVVIIIMTEYTDYYLDTWIVTTERIINIEQRGLFSRVISTLHLNQVQDVTAETHGFLATVLSYGDVYIQTAGTRERFNFKGVDNPELVKRTILHLVEDDKRRHGDAAQVPAVEETMRKKQD